MGEASGRIAALLTRAGLGLAEIDADTGCFVEVDPTFCALVGHSPAELLGVPPAAITHPDDRDRAAATLTDLRAGLCAGATIEQRYLTRDGAVVWARVTLSREPATAPTLLVLGERCASNLGVATTRSGLEEVLATLIGTSLAGIAVVRLADETILEVNETFAARLGWRPDEVVGRTTSDLALYADPEVRARLFRQVGSQGAISQAEVTVRARSGALLEFLVSVSPLELGGERCAIGVWEDVTERKRMTSALRASEDQFRAMFEVAPVGLVQSDLSTRRILRANAAMCELVGYSAEELAGMAIETLTHPDDRAGDGECFDRLRRGELTFGHLEKRYLRKDGSVVWASVSLRLLRDDRGPTDLTMAVVVDITNRHRAEQVRRLQTSALQAADSGIVITDTAGTVQWANDAFARLTGYPLDEVIGRNPRMLKSGHHDAAFYRDLWSTITAGQTWHGELVNRRRDGQLYDEEMTINPVRDLAGTITHFIAIKHDITARRRAADTLRASEDRYRSLVDNLDEVVFSVGRDGRLTFVSEAVAQFGYRPAELLGRRFDELVHPDDRAASRRDFLRLLRGEHPPAHEYRWLDGAGKVRTVRTSTRPLVVDGLLVGLTGLAADVSQQRATEDQLRVAQRMEAIGQLAGGVAHDFNNMLSVILSYSELVLDELEPASPLRDLMTEVIAASMRAAGLTRQLLAFSRRQLLQPEEVALAELVTGVTKMLRRLIGEDIVLTVDVAADTYPIEVDRGQLEQVLMNLTVNARDAMPDGGELTIAVRNLALDEADAAALELPPGDFVEVAVTDTGTGMAPDVLARIFEPFFTTKPVGKGTGLGLATVHGIVKQSGAGIAVWSEPGRGTRFRLLFPRLVARAPARRESVSPPVGPEGGRELVLVVEDEAALRHVVERVLAAAGYRVLAAADPEEALQLGAQHGDAI